MSVAEFMSNSSLVYFEPTKALFDFFKQSEWRYRRYHDCGAGTGVLTDAMLRNKLECVAYDLYPRTHSPVPVQQFDTACIAEKMDFSEVALLARPCHSPEFVDKTIKSALEMGEAFYIGKPENIARDITEFQYDVLRKDVGKAGEVLVRIRCELEKYKVRRLISNPWLGPRKEWWWYRPASRRYVSSPDGLAGFEASGNEVVHDEQFWASDLQLVTTKAERCIDDNDIGWIAPDGEWFGCSYAEHDAIAREVIGCSVHRLEGLNFVRCHGHGDGRSIWTLGYIDDNVDKGMRAPTTKQKKVLKAKDYNPERW